MKKKTELKKLKLSKTTVSKLNRNNLMKIIGGVSEEICETSDPNEPFCPDSYAC